MKANGASKNGKPESDFAAGAQRAMLKAGQQAMEDYKRYGIEPVVGPLPEKMTAHLRKGAKK